MYFRIYNNRLLEPTMGSKIDVNKINELLQPKIVEKQFDPTKSLFATEVEEGKDLNESIFLPYQMQQQFQTYRESYNMNFQSMAGRADLINKYSSELSYILLGLGVLFIIYLVYSNFIKKKKASNQTLNNED
jgi:hypothetical protein